MEELSKPGSLAFLSPKKPAAASVSSLSVDDQPSTSSSTTSAAGGEHTMPSAASAVGATGLADKPASPTQL